MQRVLAGAFLVAAALLWLVASQLSPFPDDVTGVAAKARADGELDPDHVRLAAGELIVHSYDAARQETLVFTGYCSHSLCGPLVRIAGDHRGSELEGPWLLRATGPIAIEAAPPRDESSVSWPARDEDVAFTPVFERVSPWPPYVARAGAIALAAAALALLSWPRPAALAVPAAALVVGTLPSIANNLAILVQLGGALAVLLSLVGAIVEGATKRRFPRVSAAIALAAVASIAIAIVALSHFPDAGAGD